MDLPSRSQLLPERLPDGRALLDAGRQAGQCVTPGVSLLCERFGVRSEVEYRRAMQACGRLMTCMNIGLHSWAETARALERIEQQCEARGFSIDRYQLNLDRRMGLPRELWARAPRETGPMLETDADWRGTTRTVPIQPHLGDMMIGSPMSFENARRAIEAGVTYIGNLSQFAWRYPLWTGTDVDQVSETVRALGLMAARREDDLVLHSYLDDGYAAQFKDYCSYIGWSMLEHYIVDELAGGRVASAYGGLTHDPLTKMAMILALEAIKPAGTLNSFYHGNTTAYGRCLDENFAVLSLDVMHILLAQLRTNSGAPTLPIPVSEALRIPNAEEIVQAHTLARRLAEAAPAMMDLIDWQRVEALRDRLLDGGRRFYQNLRQGLHELGIDMQDPLELLLSLRRLGAARIENRFGVGELPVETGQSYEPVIPTDTFKDFMQRRERTRSAIAARKPRVPQGLEIVVGSTDIHEYAMLLVIESLRALGIEPTIAGTSVDPDELAALALRGDARAILVSTHNGMALSYARALRAALSERGLSPLVAMGGTLNEDLDGTETPVDLIDELGQLGVTVCTEVSDVIDLMERL
ncbi:MAG: hypothetical protein KDK91_19055 [Gammaproteobacteria bacterium]|nr:hypothetical protein [Gammaproteobacteria bacterium]